MPKTPLRALRVQDELWKAAQARARACGESVSEVVRRSLAAYVEPDERPDEGAPHPIPEATPDDPLAPSLTLGSSSTEMGNMFLVAQGMVMQRFGMTADDAEHYLFRLAEVSQASLDDTVRGVLASRGTAAFAAQATDVLDATL